jgi:hypothetical protein
LTSCTRAYPGRPHSASRSGFQGGQGRRLRAAPPVRRVRPSALDCLSMVPARGRVASAELSCVRVERRPLRALTAEAGSTRQVGGLRHKPRIPKGQARGRARGEGILSPPSHHSTSDSSPDRQPCLLASPSSPPALAYPGSPIPAAPSYTLPAMPASLFGNLPALLATAKVRPRPALLISTSLLSSLGCRLRASADRPRSAGLPCPRGAHFSQG